MTYDDDPRGQHIYSPEDSDTQKYGDWQTRAVVGCLMLAAVAASAIAFYFQQ